MFPTNEEMRKAVEVEIHAGIKGRGDWFATLPDGREVCFQPSGEFVVFQSHYEGEEHNLELVEKVYKFRVVVEIVPD